jgi:hypothetical protein
MAKRIEAGDAFETEPITKVEVRFTYRDGQTCEVELSEEPDAKLMIEYSMIRGYTREFRGEEGTPSYESRFSPTGVTTIQLKATRTQSPEHPVMKNADETWHLAVAADHD